MNKTLLIIILITLISTIMFINIFKIVKMNSIFSEKYSVDNSLQSEARMLQQNYLPTSDELSEIGGSYALLQGIESPVINPKDDPWIQNNIKL